MTDVLAEAACNRAHELAQGPLTDTPYPDWPNATPNQQAFWREIVSAVTSASAKQPDNPKPAPKGRRS